MHAHINVHMHTHIPCLMRDEKEGRSEQGQTNNKAKQHSTPKAVTFPNKNELPRVGFKPTTLYALDRELYQLSYHSTCMYMHRVWD